MNAIIELSSGKLIDLLNPKCSDFDIDVICTALSRLYRFGGHTAKDYTVLHHIINCYLEGLARGYDVPTLVRLFTHDWVEAHLGDMVKPLKNCIPRYEEIEDKGMATLYEAFTVTGNEVQTHDVDFAMAKTEAFYLMPSRGEDSRWAESSEIISSIVHHNLENPQSIEMAIEQFYDIVNVLELKNICEDENE